MKPPRLDNEEHHAAPSPRTWVVRKVAAHDVYIGSMNGAQAAKNGMTKFRHAEALWRPPRLDNEEHHAVPSPRHGVSHKVAAQDAYIGSVNGAHAAKNGMTKFRHAEAPWKPPRLDNEEPMPHLVRNTE